MDNNGNNLILLSQNRIFQRNNEANNNIININKFIFSTVIYTIIVPFIIFFVTNNNQIISEYSSQNKNNDYEFIIINNKEDIEFISNKIRKLDSNNYINNINSNSKQQNRKNNSLSFHEELLNLFNLILEQFGKDFSSGNSTRNNKDILFLQKEKEMLIKGLNGNYFKGTWEYYPYIPSTPKNENNFENFYFQNFSETNKIFYSNSSKTKFNVGKEKNGTVYIGFKMDINRYTRQEILGVNLKTLEGKFIDNWLEIISLTPFSSIKKIVDEKRNKFYMRGIFVTSLIKGKITNSQNLLKFAPKCQTLIEMEFPLYKIPMYLMIGNKTEGYKVAQTINNKNFSMIISSNCGFRLKIDAVKYNLIEEISRSGIQKDLNKFFWINVTISILYICASSFTTFSLNKHQDSISAFNYLVLSQNIAWHSYCSISDINIGLTFTYFFGSFMLMAILPLINFIVFDLRLLLLYWKINKRILSNRQFVYLRLKFFVSFYFCLFCSFFLVGSIYFDKKFICISAILLWTPQIIHNIITYNRYAYPLVYILLTTADRMIFPFYFRWNGNNFLKIKDDRYFLYFVGGFIMATIIILYLQVFLGPRFMLGKKFQKKEMDFHRSRAQILKEKPEAMNEECVICLCPIFKDSPINDEENKNRIDKVENESDNNKKTKSLNELRNKNINNSVDSETKNQINIKNEDILDVANKKKMKLSNKKKLFKNKVNPIIINKLFIGKRKQFQKEKEDKIYFLSKILSIIKAIFFDNLIFFYKYSPNTKTKKYMLLLCSHVFHSECLEKWLEVKKECPSCRASIKEYI